MRDGRSVRVAEYKNMKFLHPSSDAVFDVKQGSGTKPANTGIYRCTSCGDEVAVASGQPLPSHDHDKTAGWMLIVRAEQLR